MSQQNEFQTGSRTRRVERFIALERAVVAWERLWPALWPASGVAGAFVVLALFGAFREMDWTLHAIVLAAFISLAGFLLLRGLREAPFPDWNEGARSLESNSGLKHRPISEADDTLFAGSGDHLAEDLWRANARDRLNRILRLRIRVPRSGLTSRDPRAIRFAALLLVGAGLIFAGSEWQQRLVGAFSSAGTNGIAGLDAWVDPPGYTGIAPIYLRNNSSAPHAVPIGSLLTVRVHGADHAPGLSVGGEHAGLRGSAGEYSSTIRIAEAETVSVRASGRSLGNWNFRVIPDLPPKIQFLAPPGATERGALRLSFHATDDYGVTNVRAVIEPHDRPGAPVAFELPIPDSSKSVRNTVYRDLTEHPYAGLKVDIWLEASDAIGQKGRTPSVQFTLPARVFTDPLARALIEQRQNLAGTDLKGRERTALTLTALTIAPDKFYQDRPSVYLGIRSAYWALQAARHDDDLQRVQSLLWDIAVSIEQGGLVLAAEELRRLQALLTAALEQGAPENVVDALLQRYQDALRRYVQSLAQNAPNSSQPLPPDAKVLSEKDLNDLLKAIEQLSQSGDRAQAAQLLALLQSLVENLHMSAAAGGADTEQDKALKNTIGNLGALVGKQRGLLDKTFRQLQGGGSGTGKPLAKEQGDVRGALGKVLQDLKRQKGGESPDLSEAEREMSQSENELGGNDLGASEEAQKQALNALRRGADALAKQLMDRQSGREGTGEENQDPLGRTQGNFGGNLGNGVKLPSQSELERARSILEELRRRAAERDRPKEELDYIDRLLKEF